MVIILAVLGEKLSGKDTIAQYLVEKHGAFHTRYSHLLDEILTILHLPITRRNENDLGYGLREHFGVDVLSKALINRVKQSTADLIVMNSFRFQEEVDAARALGAKFIYVTAPKELRYQRAIGRTEKGSEEQMHEVFEQQEKEVYETNIPKLGTQADYRIDNTGSLEDLYTKIEVILTEVKTRHETS